MTLGLLWLCLEPLLHLSASELLRILRFERSAQPCPSLPYLSSASTRCPAESRTFSLRRRFSAASCWRTSPSTAARGSVARGLSGLQVLPAAFSSVNAALWFLDFSSTCSAWWRWAFSQRPSRAQVPLLSFFTVEGCATGLARVRLQCCRARAPAVARAPAPTSASLGAADDSHPSSTGGNVAATRVLPIAKASTPPASSDVFPLVSGGRAARDKRRRRTARTRRKRASQERFIWKDISSGSSLLSPRDVSRATSSVPLSGKLQN